MGLDGPTGQPQLVALFGGEVILVGHLGGEAQVEGQHFGARGVLFEPGGVAA